MDDNLDHYRERYLRSYGSLDLDAARARFRAIVGTDNLPDTPEGKLAKSALTKFKTGDAQGPTPPELAALEYLIRLVRPAPLFRNGVPEDFTAEEFLHAFPDWTAFQKLIPRWSFAVGRVDRVKGDPAGTGFLVAPTLLVTNNHVLDVISFGVRKLARGQATVRFRWEFGGSSVPEAPVDILDVVATHETLDACLLRIVPIDMSDREPFRIAAQPPDLYAEVVAIGYPFEDTIRNPLFISQIFGTHFGVKRGAPGCVTGIGEKTSAVFHDCSTLGGNSGSPLVAMSNGEVVGLHTGGGFLWRNESVDCVALAQFIGSVQ
jgi:S1-C subfamily serine protease